MLHTKKTRKTAYHLQGNGQVESFHRTLRALLKTQLEDAQDCWDKHLDYLMMAYHTTVHTSTGYSPFRLMFGREIRVLLGVMMEKEETTESHYEDFVAELEKRLTRAYQDVRVKLGIAQRRQKDAYEKGIKQIYFESGDRVTLFNPQLKPIESSKFHRLWTAPYIVKKRVTEIT